MLGILGAQVSRGFLDVLITATAEVYQEDVFWLHSRCALQGVGDGVTRLKGGENAFKAAELLKSGERRRVGGVGIVDAAVLPVVGVFRPHSGVAIAIPCHCLVPLMDVSMQSDGAMFRQISGIIVF